MTRPLVSPLALVAASLLVALGGCELLKRNEDALKVINTRVIGMPAGDFFDRYGRAGSRVSTADGGASYDWTSRVDNAVAGPAGLDDRICKLRLAVDPRGRIGAVQVQYDGPGRTSTSRCAEVFAAG